MKFTAIFCILRNIYLFIFCFKFWFIIVIIIFIINFFLIIMRLSAT